MRTTGSSWQTLHAGRVIDVTPMPWWLRTVRKSLRVLGWLAAIPVLLVFGGVMLLLVMGILGAILVLGWVRIGRRHRHGAYDDHRWTSGPLNFP